MLIRGVATLDASAAWDDIAGGVHTTCRRKRLDIVDRRMGALPSVPRCRDMVGIDNRLRECIASAIPETVPFLRLSRPHFKPADCIQAALSWKSPNPSCCMKRMRTWRCCTESARSALSSPWTISEKDFHRLAISRAFPSTRSRSTVRLCSTLGHRNNPKKYWRQ